MDSVLPRRLSSRLPVLCRLAAGFVVFAISSVVATCRLADLVNPAKVSTLRPAPAELVDSARAGSLAPRVTTLALEGEAEAVRWSLRPIHGTAWLKPSDTTGMAPDTLRITLDPASLSAGDYQDSLVFTVGGLTVAPVIAPVTFHVMGCTVTDVTPSVALVDSLAAADCGAPHRAGHLTRLYRITGAANDSVSLQLASAAFGAYLVLDSGAAQAGIPSMAESSGGCRPGLAGACLTYVRLPVAGSYVVEATSVAGGATGTYTLSVTRPRPPAAPDTLAQLLGDGATVVPAGTVITHDTVDFRASLADPDSDSVRVEIEVQPLGTTFTNTATSTSAMVGSGAEATILVAGLANHTSYHWQARAVDRTGRSSAWVPFGSGGTDFRINYAQAPSVPANLAQLKSGRHDRHRRRRRDRPGHRAVPRAGRRRFGHAGATRGRGAAGRLGLRRYRDRVQSAGAAGQRRDGALARARRQRGVPLAGAGRGPDGTGQRVDDVRGECRVGGRLQRRADADPARDSHPAGRQHDGQPDRAGRARGRAGCRRATRSRASPARSRRPWPRTPRAAR